MKGAFNSHRELVPDSPYNKTRSSSHEDPAETQSNQHLKQETIEETTFDIDEKEETIISFRSSSNFSISDPYHAENDVEPDILQDKEYQSLNVNDLTPRSHDNIGHQNNLNNEGMEGDSPNSKGIEKELKEQNLSPHENLNRFESEGKSEGSQIVQSSNRARFKIGDQLEVTAESRRGEGTFRSRNWVAPPSKGVGRVIKVNWEENDGLEPSYTYDIKYPVEGIDRGVEEGTLAIHNPDENKTRKSKGRCREIGCGCLVVDCGHLQPGERGYISPEEREVYKYIYVSTHVFMHTHINTYI